MSRIEGNPMENQLNKFKLRDRKISEKIITQLKTMRLDINLMHVCGTHQDTIIKYGLESLFRKCGVNIRQGPGCPVCVTTQKEIEECILLARKNKTITVFGDMLKVPSLNGSLSDWKAKGCDIRIVYGIDDAVDIARNEKKDVVFMGIGFETTSPTTAAVILNKPPLNFYVLSCHRTVPPVLRTLIQLGELKLDGIIEPGHVSTIIGARPYKFLSRDYHVPQVIAGFEPLDVMMGVYMLAKQICNGESKVEIEYTRSVKYEGNPKAIKIMYDVFETCDVAWRGFPVINGSGLKLRKRFKNHDARIVFKDELKDIENVIFKEPKGCRCGDLLRGIIDSQECPLFRKVCTPQNPIGPCMVSSEGSCNIVYRYCK